MEYEVTVKNFTGLSGKRSGENNAYEVHMNYH